MSLAPARFRAATRRRVSYQLSGRRSGQLFCSSAPLLCFHLAFRPIDNSGRVRDEGARLPSAINNPGETSQLRGGLTLAGGAAIFY